MVPHTDRFRKIEAEIKSILRESPIGVEVEHADAVLKYVLIIKPDADEALQIAALAHDIDRGFYKISETTHLKDFKNITDFKVKHSQRSAKVLRDLMEKNGYGKKDIDRATKLVVNHEFGGSKDADVLRAADSISYFETNIYEYLDKNGLEKTIEKIRFRVKGLPKNELNIIKSIKFEDKEIGGIVKNAIKEFMVFNFDQPFAIVGALVERDGKFLLVREFEGPDKGKWNIPAVRWDSGESLAAGATRAVGEETGYNFDPQSVIGIYTIIKRYPTHTASALRIVFAGQLLGEDRDSGGYSHKTEWFSADDIINMSDDELRSADYKVLLKDYRSGKRYPLDMINFFEQDMRL